MKAGGPGLILQRDGTETELQAWGLELIERIHPVAALLDAQRGEDVHVRALQSQLNKLQSPQLTPSARVLAALASNGGSFTNFALRQSAAHAADFRARPLSEDERAYYTSLAQTSLVEQERMERTQVGSFDEFITEPPLPDAKSAVCLAQLLAYCRA